jgi:uncharacterized repeat protein (TIGR01451 family)
MLPYRMLSVASRTMLAVSIICSTFLTATPALARTTHPEGSSIEEITQIESELPLHTLTDEREDGSQTAASSSPPQNLDDQDLLIVDESAEPVLFELTAEPGVVAMGEEINFTVVITNNGKEPLKELIFTDTLEKGLNFSPSKEPNISYDPITRTVTVKVDHLDVGKSIEFLYSARLVGMRESRPRGEF